MRQEIPICHEAVSPPLLLSGVDTLEVSYYLCVPTSNLDLEDLEYRKERLRADGGRQGFDQVTLGTETFALKPYGRDKYKFILSNQAFEVMLAEHMRPSCRVKVFSKALWHEGLEAALERFERWCHSMALVKTQREVVTRADWAFDFHLPTVDFKWTDFVSRAVKDNAHRASGKVQTFQFGKGDVVVRVYDKAAEIEEKSGKVWFYDLWGRESEVWRVEFQVRRAALKKHGIHTVGDLNDLQYDLLADLAMQHTTLRRRTEDTNRSRWPLHPLWRALLGNIHDQPRTGLVREYDERKALEYRLHKSAQAAYGHLKGLMALECIRSNTPPDKWLEDAVERLLPHLEEHHYEVAWEADVNQRVQGFALGEW